MAISDLGNLIKLAAFVDKIVHPDFLPFTEKATEIEPEISETAQRPTIGRDTNYPLLVQNMKSLPQLRSGLGRHTSRSKRIAYIRRMLQDSYTQISEEKDELDFNESEPESAIPAGLALMMTSPLLSSAPGISARSYKGTMNVPSSRSISPIKEEDEEERP